MLDRFPIQPGKLISDRYRIQEQIGGGRMSSVYRASDESVPNISVAVKILDTSHPDGIKQELFKRETAALKRLNHPHIVRLRDSGLLDNGGPFFLVLDYLPYSLDACLQGDSAPRPENFDPHRIMRELAQALAHAHSQNVIHRDIKPSNILLDENGRSCLSDFGISKLLTHLSIGQTLAGFWSPGYAAPEQQAGQPASFKSDLYSLGAVFYHLLSGMIPPSEGPRPAAVGNYVRAPGDIRAILETMLDENPDQRKYTSSELAASLEGITRQIETLPTQLLILTNNAVRRIRDTGRTRSDNRDHAGEVIINNLGGMELNEVYVQQSRQDPDVIRILGDSLLLICKPNKETGGLVVIDVQAPYQAELERQKESAMPYRAYWEMVKTSEAVPHNNDLSGLLEQLSNFEKSNATERENRRSRWDFIERWQSALSKQEERISKNGLPYNQVEESKDYWQFTLSEPPPDNLNWEEVPLEAIAPRPTATGRRPRSVPVGNLAEIRGKILTVDKESRFLSRRNLPDLPQSGLLTPSRVEITSEIRRQQKAVREFRYGSIINPALANIIVEPGQATHTPSPSLEYYQEWLSDDKKEAVSKAVSSNELFLIQGPPGTGKTAVIAEITLQILRRNPNARILLSSQSNIAVDHALAQIAKAAGETPPAMIRLGRPEKISGESWTIQGRANDLRRDVQEKCGVVLEELAQAERQATADAKITDVVSETGNGIELRIENAKELVTELREYERDYAMAQRERNRDLLLAYVNASLEDTQSKLKNLFADLAESLSLSVEYDGTNADEVLERIIRAAASQTTTDNESVGTDSEPAAADAELSKIQEMSSIISDWMQVAGQTADMMKLIVDQSSIVAATCSYSGGKRMPETAFDWAIIDEAGRATVPEVLIPIAKSQRLILVGDERQLPPMVDDAISQDETVGALDGAPLDTSLFQTLVEQAEQEDHWHLAGLRSQYRMHPAIGNLISQVFYDGKLEQGLNSDHFQDYNWVNRQVSWWSTSALPNRDESRRNPSFENRAEAELIFQWLQEFENQCRQRNLHPEVGIISGYQAQVELITRLVDPANTDRWQNMQVEAATVDSFQGRECDVILYSTVRSNQQRNIGFQRDFRRINVALSRARNLLIIVGDDFMMQNAAVELDENPFAKVLQHIRQHPGECEIIQASQGAQ